MSANGWLLAVAVATAEPLPPVPKPCGPVVGQHSQIAGSISDAVRETANEQIQALAEVLHGPEEQQKTARQATVSELIRWKRNSKDLGLLEACAEKDRTVFRYANTMTDMVDELRLTFEGDRLKRVAVAPAIRVLAGTRPEADAARITELDKYVQGLTDQGLFSGVVMVGRGGDPAYARAFGYADAASHRPNQVDTMFNLASLNKIFTAVAVLRLIEDARLSFSTTLADVLKAEVAGKPAAAVRIDQLLSHTSGLNNSLDQLSFEPGTSYSYSNLGFVTLGKVIEAVAKVPYEDFVRLHVLGPAGMSRTGIYEASAPVEWLSTGYMTKIEGLKVVTAENPLLQTYAGNAAGGWWSNAPELLKFAEALQNGHLLEAETLGLMRRAKPELGAREYGFGVIRWRAPGVWGHAGDLPGTDTDLEIDCDTGTTLIVLANRDNVNAPVLAKARSLFFSGKCDF